MRIADYGSNNGSTMTALIERLPLFPLGIFLLPSGITRLKVFEPRYLRLVRIAMKEHGFVIFPHTLDANNLQSNNTELLWGSWVDIINFDQGDDGVLEIDVQCKFLVRISTLAREADALHFADAQVINHWSERVSSQKNATLSRSLMRLFENNKILNEIYADKQTNDRYWVIARWLELLPVNLTIKYQFVLDNNFAQAEGFVASIIN